jgi:hypothetical protein
VKFFLEAATLNRELQAWERIYNTIRSHQARGYLTHHQFVTHWQHYRKEKSVPDHLNEYRRLTAFANDNIIFCSDSDPYLVEVVDMGDSGLIERMLAESRCRAYPCG